MRSTNTRCGSSDEKTAVPLSGPDCGKRKRRQLAARHPPHLLSDHRLGIAVKPAAIEIQFDSLLRVCVRNGVDEIANVRGDVELFVELTPQSLDVRLGWMAFAAGKLPVPGQMGARRAQCE